MAKDETPYGNLQSLDPAKRAAASLSESIEKDDLNEDIIVHDKNLEEKHDRNRNSKKKKEGTAQVLVGVEEALTEKRIIVQQSDRQRVRVLILTRDASALTFDSASQKRFVEYSKMFAEVHVVVLCMIGASVNEPARIADNVWVYPTHSLKWCKTVFDAYRIVQEQLAFAQGFRVDIILAEDPFESGVVGRYLAKKYDRAFQVHILENYFAANFKDKDRHNTLRLSICRYVLSTVDCVRTKTESIKEEILNRYPKLEKVTEILPTYYNFQDWQDKKTVYDLHVQYPKFKFILLHISTMTIKSHTEDVIDGIFHLIKRYSTMCLVIVGDGPEKASLERRVQEFNIVEQVIFEPKANDVVSYIKTADVLVHTSVEF